MSLAAVVVTTNPPGAAPRRFDGKQNDSRADRSGALLISEQETNSHFLRR
jgi:hypothetical protein